MKNLFILFAFSFVLWSCQEEGPFINLEEDQVALVDTSYTSPTTIAIENKNVLFEEFSGVRCSNCPVGNTVTHDLYVQYGEQFVPVTVHSDFLAFPYTGSPDLRNADANEIANSLGPVGQKPSTFVNRKIINGNRLQGSTGTWAGLVASELQENTFVNMDLAISAIDEVERTVRYRITLSYSADAPNHNLGFYITESEIIAEQLDGSTKIEDYEHEFVLRKAITPIIGTNVASSVDANTVIVKEFEIDIDEFDGANEWNMAHMHLVAFIRLDNDNIENAVMVDFLP